MASAPQRLLWYSRAVLAATTAAVGLGALAGWRPSLAAQAWAYLALMIGLGLPHGGYEHVENLLGRGAGFQWRYLAAYVGLAGAALAAFLLAPLVGFGVALTVTVLKSGHGGLAVLEETGGDDHLRTRPQRALAVAARGGAVMAVPLVAHPDQFWTIGAALLGLFGGGDLAWLLAPATRAGLAATYSAALLAHISLGYARGGGPAWRGEAAEALLLVAFFAVVPPLLAVGLYFPVWYAGRQVARVDAAGGLPASRLAALGRIARRGALPWTGALAGLAATATLLPQPPGSVYGWVALYTAFVVAIAVPHVAVGSWLDRRRGIWSTA